MTDSLRVQVETGPKGKKVVAVAVGWPGLARGAKTEDDAIEKLRTYLSRYEPIAKQAGLAAEFTTSAGVDVAERYSGTGSTDFWGISFGFSDHDREPMTNSELDRELSLMRACWAYFDAVASSVSEVLQKGPRGGGRDRDKIIEHIYANELQWSPRSDLNPPLGEMLTDQGLLRRHRENYVAAIRDLHTRGEKAGKWPLRYMIRHTAFHTMDHAWEMEDKDLTDTAS